MDTERSSAAAYRAIWRAVRRTGQWQGETRYRTKAGVERPQWLAVSALTDERGAVTHYVAVFSDLTERKAEQERFNFLALHDPLTGLPNRQLRPTLAQHRCGDPPAAVALLFLDLTGSGDQRFSGTGRRLLLCIVATGSGRDPR
jgi:hypothetical protein